MADQTKHGEKGFMSSSFWCTPAFQAFLFPSSADSMGRCEEQLYFYFANDYGVDGRHSAGPDNSKFSNRKMQVVPQNVFLPLEMYNNWPLLTNNGAGEGNYSPHCRAVKVD